MHTYLVYDSWMSIVRFFVKNIFSREIHVFERRSSLENRTRSKLCFLLRTPSPSQAEPFNFVVYLIDISDQYSMLRTRKDLLGPARLLENDINDRKVNLKNSMRLQHRRLFSDIFRFTRVDRYSFRIVRTPIAV